MGTGKTKRATGQKKASQIDAETVRQLLVERVEALAATKLPQAPLPVPLPMKPEEQARAAAFSKRHADRGVPVAVSLGDQSNHVAFKQPDALADAALAETLGVTDPALAQAILQQVVQTMPKQGAHVAESINLALSALHEIGPKDGVEGLLAAQMVATSNLAMKFLGRAATAESGDGMARDIELATKLQRTFTSQIEALNRYRGKGQQKMTVEHVHVYEGGQAVVGGHFTQSPQAGLPPAPPFPQEKNVGKVS